MGERKSELAAGISRTMYDRLIAICLGCYPQEACGILAGNQTSNSASTARYLLPIAAHIYPIVNAALIPESSFRFQPENWVSTFYDIQKNQQTLVGFFHSHPHSPAVPSLHDKQGWPFGAEAAYWIVSLTDLSQPKVEAYKPVKGEKGLMFTQIGVEIT